MKATIKLNNILVEVEAEKQNELFSQLAQVSEIFGESKCGLCGGTAIKPTVRHVTSGKKTYDYYEWVCLNQACRAKLSLGQNLEGDTLFPKRKLDPKGKPDSENGKYGKHNGWSKYRGEMPPAEGESDKKGF